MVVWMVWCTFLLCELQQVERQAQRERQPERQRLERQLVVRGRWQLTSFLSHSIMLGESFVFPSVPASRRAFCQLLQAVFYRLVFLRFLCNYMPHDYTFSHYARCVPNSAKST